MIEHEKYFKILNERLKEKNESLTLYTVGGFALKCYGIKTTMDVDAFYDTNDTIEKIIADIGNEYNINPLNERWINKAVAYLKDKRVKSPNKEISKLINKYSNLEIYCANLDYLFIMKVFAVYDGKKDKVKHLDDCKKILESGKISVKNFDDFKKTCKECGFSEVEDLKNTIDEILSVYNG